MSYWLNSGNEMAIFSTLLLLPSLTYIILFNFPELGRSLTMPGALANSIQVSSPYLLDGDCVQRFYSHASKIGMEKSRSSQRKAFLLWCVSAAFPSAFQTTTGFVSSPKFTPVKECPVEIQHTKGGDKESEVGEWCGPSSACC